MKIFLAIPTINKLYPSTVEVLFDILKHTKHEISINFISQQPIDLVRNEFVEKFLESDCDILWFLDDDQLPPKNVLDLLDNDFDIIAPLTYVYQDHNLIPNLWLIEDNRKVIKKAVSKKLEKVDACGMGCVFIQRKVFEELEKPYFSFVCNNDMNKLMISETFFFFNKAKEKDFKIFVSTQHNCGHIKHFNLDLLAYQMNKVADITRKMIGEKK